MEQSTPGNQSVSTNRDEQIMFAFIEEQKQSGLIVKAFCEEKNIPPHSFYYWNKKYRDKNTSVKNGKTSFTMLDIQDNVSGTLFCELITAAGGRLKFNRIRYLGLVM
ncbi:MAG: hypothetical protein IRZ01_01670 [Thermoflavifilum aggregans]|nr:hypothetical protein [Thermoflavifilum aggregans]